MRAVISTGLHQTNPVCVCTVWRGHGLLNSMLGSSNAYTGYSLPRSRLPLVGKLFNGASVTPGLANIPCLHLGFALQLATVCKMERTGAGCST